MDREKKFLTGIVLLGAGTLLAVVAATIAAGAGKSEGARPIQVATPAKLPAAPPAPHQWFIADSTFTSCFQTKAPADHIADMRANGEQVYTKDDRGFDGSLTSVEISTPVSGGFEERYWTYYTSMNACQASLAARNRIPDDYR
jgi:hypothetical protein